ncbi:hypothetical protein BDN70DRAFT_885307 [Pholiota conissans]|uniref:Uncharacterized protein n=1 Tax=Pholiota conissans TaxID=109636 RepID=A0A9P5YQJ3_9AGAR|nr:hypothetical protein BDN70DRAFT_885307 [Pholiota conissans]
MSFPQRTLTTHQHRSTSTNASYCSQRLNSLPSCRSLARNIEFGYLERAVHTNVPILGAGTGESVLSVLVRSGADLKELLVQFLLADPQHRLGTTPTCFPECNSFWRILLGRVAAPAVPPSVVTVSFTWCCYFISLNGSQKRYSPIYSPSNPRLFTKYVRSGTLDSHLRTLHRIRTPVLQAISLLRLIFALVGCLR